MFRIPISELFTEPIEGLKIWRGRGTNRLKRPFDGGEGQKKGDRGIFFGPPPAEFMDGPLLPAKHLVLCLG